MDKRIQKALDFIEKHYHNKILLEDLAARSKLSAFHFQRLFKKEMNETPAQCLSRIRLERAAHLMRVDSQLSIVRVAKDCGFSSPSIFSRAFSRYFNLSPSEFCKREQPIVQVTQSTNIFDQEIKVELIQFQELQILYSRTSILHQDFLKAFERSASFCEMNDIRYGINKRIGVFTDSLFHGPKGHDNYFAGVPLVKQVNEAVGDRVFSIPPGKYASFTTNSSYLDFVNILMQFKVFWMDKHNLVIKELFGFEEFTINAKSSDYPNIRRKIYIPVRQKS